MPTESQSRDALCAALEREYVHSVYNKTAHHFADVRYKAWPRVKQFLLDLPPGALVADVGCGSGKYLSINKSIVTVGCDHSTGLLQVARQQGHQVLSCDNLKLPFREGCFDAIISIGVIHHFTTPSRRARAIQELSRVLRPGGSAIVCVWAMEQKHRKFKAQDVLVPWHLKVRHITPGKHNEESRKVQDSRKELASPADLSVTGNIDNCHIGSTHHYSYRGNIDSAPPIPSSCRSRDPNLRNSYVKSKALRESSSQGPESGATNFRYMLKNHFRIQRKKGSSPVMSEATPVFPSAVSEETNKESFQSSDSQKEGQNSKQVVNTVTPNSADNDVTTEKLRFPSLIKSKLARLIGRLESTAGDQSEVDHMGQQAQKDLKYKQLLDEIVREDSKLFAGCQGDGVVTVVPSVYAFEGFAVREFPASSRTSVNDKRASEASENDKKNGVLTEQEIGENFKTSGLGPNSDPDYKQKCASWLEQTSHYKVNRPENLPLVGHCTAIVNHTDDTANGFTSNGDVFSSPEWEKVTSKLIKSLESQVDGASSGATVQATRLDSSQYNSRVTDMNQCTCTSRQISVASGESGGYDRTGASMSAGRHRHRSDSTLSSVSSMSSDSDSLRSDIEEVAVCAVCRGDSVEYGVTIDNMSSPASSSSSSSDNKQASDIPADISKSSQNVDGGRGGRDIPNTHPAQIKTQLASLRTSHDSGYSEPGGNTPQDLPPPKHSTQHAPRAHISSRDEHHCQPVSGPPTCPTATEEQPDKDSYKRFYHVFREGELVSLIEKRVKGLHVLESFYDHANWCVIVQKI